MPATPSSQLLALDRNHVWHPYASMTDPTPVRLVADAVGVRIRLHDGTELIDAMSSWWCAVHGYRHPLIDEAVRRQLATMSHVMFGGLTHEPAISLARLLVELTPDPLQHVFFADSGSVAVEVALKMATQYQRGRGNPGRTRTMALLGGYHGDTLGAMSVCDPVTGMHTMFADSLTEQVFAPRPPAGRDADIADWEVQTRAIAAAHAEGLGAIICEPVLQGAGGMHVYNPDCLRVLRQVADEHDLVLIFDEIATGFGRTGTFFAADRAAIAPDIMCVGKALTGGYLTLAATLCTSEVARGVAQSEAGVLMHGPTFMANPLACAAAVTSIRMLLQQGWQREVLRLEAGLRTGLQPACSLPGVADVRVIGAVGVIQLDRDVNIARATDAAAVHGVWLRPFRDLLYAMPAYVMDDADLAQVCTAMVAATQT
ncbi:MAG: adenosylmethionine--8-amino-7-oxononanoate transaminase [Nocardioidaceae bacterium]